jgi:hypothetical protein
MEEPSVTAAATAAGIHRSTLHGYLKDPEFAGAYRARRRDALSHATAKLQKSAADAVATLARLASDEEAPPASQVAAASKVLDYAYRADVFEDIAAKLDELEEIQDER